jgi:hyperosmotically inducible protein
MKITTRKNSLTARKSWLLGASLPAIMLVSGLAATQVHANNDEKVDQQLESRSATEAVSDGWITTKVKSKLVADQEVSGFDISVETRDKVVYLSGEVENQSQVSHAVEIAEDTKGVKRVDSTALRIGTAVDQVKDAIDRSS